MKITVFPSLVKGSITAPRSKSSMQRACALSLIRKGETRILLPGSSNDDKAALSIVTQMGSIVKSIDDHTLSIDSQGLRPVSNQVSCGESGLSIRMFTPILATISHEITIEGEGSLKTRPMDFFDQTLPQLDVHIVSSSGKLPLVVRGPLVPKNIHVSGALSSQYITGLLLAYASQRAHGVSLHVDNLNSKPYIALTLAMMRHFGYAVRTEGYEVFHFEEATYKNVSAELVEYTVEGDWSGGAFLLIAAAIAGDIVVGGLEKDSVQADKAVLEAMRKAGVVFEWMNDSSMLIKQSDIQPFEFDATDCPDLFPPLVALASYGRGITKIKGANRLTHKESNRSLSLQEEFGKMGISIVLEDDIMLIHGTGKLTSGTHFSSHNDHRIAMAIAIATLRADGAVTIAEAQAINKSYPDFYDHLRALGAKCEEA